jgi:ubiquinone/menaquinone biosynthesis C-methylase UbiE
MNFEQPIPQKSKEELQKQESERAIEFLDLDEKQLEGKSTLDLGSGDIDLAGYYKDNPDIKIVSVDIKKPEGEVKNFVQADAAAMPFEDESFDMIISMGGPVKIVEDPKKVKKILQETKRLLKKNGEAKIGQGWISPGVLETPKEDLPVEERFKYFREKSLEYLEGLGFSQVEEIQKGEDIMMFYYRLVK